MTGAKIIVLSINCYRSAWYLLAAFVCFAPVGMASATLLDVPVRVEVFTTTDRQVVESVKGTREPRENFDLTVYELNVIQLVEAELSKDLTADPDQSERLILHRIQVLGDQTQTRMQRSAIGLVKAMQYGVDRVPAIVFDGQAVLYGVTDLQVALVYYQAWRTRDTP